MTATNFDGRRENRGKKILPSINHLTIAITRRPTGKKNTSKISTTQQKKVFGRRETLHTQP
jgi:hypothetical protein